MAISQSSYNGVNQLTNRSTSGGPVQFAGYLSKQATVTVAGNAAVVNHQTTNFVGYASVSLGTNTVPVVATDYTTNQNSATNVYQLVVTNNGVSETVAYDANGNQTSVITATSTNTYQWDAANRLVSITGPVNQSLFAYDGLGRRTQIIELQNGVSVSTNNFIWDGQALVEQRDNTGTNVVKRFFGQGEQISGTNYYFTRDHLGSVREVTGATGIILARYDYDPYGRMTGVSGGFNADFGYAGMYYHAATGLNLTLYRAYNADLGRWLNRDPIGERGGINQYRYVRNGSLRFVDKLGLQTSEEEEPAREGESEPAFGESQPTFEEAEREAQQEEIQNENAEFQDLEQQAQRAAANAAMAVTPPDGDESEGDNAPPTAVTAPPGTRCPANRAQSLALQLEDLGGGVPTSVPTSKGAPQFIFPNGPVLRFDLQPGQYLEGQGPHINLQFVPGWPNQNIHIPLAE